MTTTEDRLTPLAARARAGDEAAYDQLLGAVVPRLELYVRVRLAGRGGAIGPEQVADVVQEALLGAHEAFDRLEWHGERAFLGWLCRIADTRILRFAEHHRARKRTPGELERISAIAGRVAASTRGVVTRADRLEQRARLTESLAKLATDEREAVMLRFFEGLEIARVAERLGRTDSSTRRLLARAVRALGAGFDAEGA